MIWAPRGISSTYSARVGRSARYRAPRDVAATVALRGAEEGVVGHEAPVRVERLARAERHEVALAPPEVDEEDHLAGPEDASSAIGAVRRRRPAR